MRLTRGRGWIAGLTTAFPQPLAYRDMLAYADYAGYRDRALEDFLELVTMMDTVYLDYAAEQAARAGKP